MNEKLYNEIFEIIIELNEGMEERIEENDYSDFLNDRTYDVIKEIYNELEILLKTIYRKNDDDCQEKYMETVVDEVYEMIVYQSMYKLNTIHLDNNNENKLKRNTMRKFNHFEIFTITLNVVYIVSQVSLICFAMFTAYTNI